jgi:hypothetical protein
VTVRRGLVAAFVVLLVVVAIVDASWIPLVLLVAVLMVGVPYALVQLTRGQGEWFGRHHDRPPRRRRR